MDAHSYSNVKTWHPSRAVIPFQIHSLSSSETGLVLHFQGYSSVVVRLMSLVLKGMTEDLLTGETVKSRWVDSSVEAFGHVMRRQGGHSQEIRCVITYQV